MARPFLGSWYMIDEIDLAAMVAHHARLAHLCTELEGVADGLPALPPRHQAERLRDELLHALPANDARDRVTIGHLLHEVSRKQPGRGVLEEIGNRRTAILVQAQDIAVALDPGDYPEDPETVGYMLRSFFQSCRQSMVVEELAVLHLTGTRLTSTAHALLVDSLARRCAE